MSYIKRYIKDSKSPLYSLIFIAPVLIGYEILLFTLNQSDIEGIRNGADVLIRRIFHHFNIYGFYFVGFLVLLSLFLAFQYRLKKGKSVKLKFNYFLLMLLESFFYAFLLIVILNKSNNILSAPAILNTKLHLLIMALGAGIYEEFVFRVIMIGAGLFFFNKLLRWNQTTSKILAIIFASILFSIFHYIGEFGDVFLWRSFFLRTIAGLLLSVLYITRGYGITAYTHTIYDLIIVFL